MKEREDLILNPVPKSERIGWGAPLFNVLGTNIALSALMVGGTLIGGLTFKDVILASVIGNLILVAIFVIQGNIGSREGLNTYVIATGPFGEIGGRWVISLVLGITSFGWFGIQAGVAGLSVQQIFPGINVTLAIIILGFLMVIVATLGFRTMALFNYIAIPPLVILLIWGVYRSMGLEGSVSLSEYVPADPMTFTTGIDLVVGMIIVGAVISPDYLRYTRNLVDVLIVGIVAVGLVTVFQQVAAAAMSVSAPSWDITQVLSNLGFGWIAFVILVLAAWSTNLSNAYSGGLALKNVFQNVNRTTLTFISGTIGTIIAALGFINLFQDFLSFLSSTVSAIAGIIWVEYYIIQKKKLVVRKGTNWLAIIAWVAGIIVANISSVYSLGIGAINSILAAGIVYFILIKAFDKTETKENPSENASV